MRSGSQRKVRRHRVQREARFELAENLESRVLMAANIVVNKAVFFFNDISSSASGGSGASPNQTLRITNTGDANLTLPSGAITISGTNGSEFHIGSFTTPRTIAPGTFVNVSVNFSAAAVGIRTANLNIKSNDPDTPTRAVRLRGLGTAGTGGNLEPSLQRILDLYQYKVNVGDNNASDTTYPVPPVTPNDEVTLPRLLKAGTGNVTFELLGVFVNSKTPATALGYYSPGTPDDSTQLLTVPSSADAQTVHPTVSGSTSFDPGSSAFSLYSVFPAFTNRRSYSEDSLNTWETNTSKQRKIRFFKLKDANGTVVPNAYIFAAEDWNVAYDFNDVVGIVRNVKAAPAGAEIGTSNADGAPFFDHLVFNRITHLDQFRPNKVHDKSVLTVRNTGSSTLNVSSTVLGDTTDFKVISGGGAFSVAPGSTHNITVQFVGSGTGTQLAATFNSTLTINSNDADEPVKKIALGAEWQLYSEQTPETHPRYGEMPLPALMSVWGYGTKFINSGQTTNHGGDPTLIGDEVISPYWFRADGNAPVTVRQLAAFHRQNNFDANHNPTSAASTISWYLKGSSSSLNKILTHNIDQGQSFLPFISGSTTQYAVNTFTPSSSSTSFGFKVDNRFSDDKLNPLDNGKANTGHSFRFFPAKDEKGHTIPNTWIVAMDYTGLSYSNYDYNDNIYLVSNMKPASTTSPAPQPLVANGTANSLAYDSSGTLHLAYYDPDAKQLKYATRSTGGTWSDVSVVDNSGDNAGSFVSLAVASNNTVGVAYYDSTTSDLKYASHAAGSSTWSVQTIDSRGSTGQYTSLAFDHRNRPFIAYYSRTGGDLKLAWNTTGSRFGIMNVDTTGDVGRCASAAFDSLDRFSVAYADNTTGDVRFAIQTSGAGWNRGIIQHTTGGSAYMSTAYDRSRRATVSFYDAAPADLKYAVLNRGVWHVDNVASTGAVGAYSQLSYNTAGTARILFYDKTHDQVMQSSGSYDHWSTTMLKSDGGQFLDIAPTSGGSTGSYAWYATSDGMLKVSDLA